LTIPVDTTQKERRKFSVQLLPPLSFRNGLVCLPVDHTRLDRCHRRLHCSTTGSTQVQSHGTSILAATLGNSVNRNDTIAGHWWDWTFPDQQYPFGPSSRRAVVACPRTLAIIPRTLHRWPRQSRKSSNLVSCNAYSSRVHDPVSRLVDGRYRTSAGLLWVDCDNCYKLSNIDRDHGHRVLLRGKEVQGKVLEDPCVHRSR
jgi:hypothetical protein